jgi:hypothetical protein
MRCWLIAASLPLLVTGAESVQAQTKIFRCVVDGRAVFGDKPCPDTLSVEVSVASHNTYRGAESAPSKPSSLRPSAQRQASKPDRSAEVAEQKQQERCRNFTKQLAQIESTMRAGYKAKQGEKLRDRQRALQERQVAERCR